MMYKLSSSTWMPWIVRVQLTAGELYFEIFYFSSYSINSYYSSLDCHLLICEQLCYRITGRKSAQNQFHVHQQLGKLQKGKIKSINILLQNQPPSVQFPPMVFQFSLSLGPLDGSNSPKQCWCLCVHQKHQRCAPHSAQ